MYENESVTSLARLGKVDNAAAKAKLSKTFLVDFITFETESEKSTVSDRMAEYCVLEPLKILESESEMVGLSVSPLNPVKILSMTSDGVGASDRNFPADLLMLSEINEVKSSDVALNPVKSLESASDTVGLSESPLKPMKILFTTSDRVGASERNLPADLLMLTEIVDRSSV